MKGIRELSEDTPLGSGEIRQLISMLEIEDKANADWAILLAIKTGMRLGEILALTLADIYINESSMLGGYIYVSKSRSAYSNDIQLKKLRRVVIDVKLSKQLSELTAGLIDKDAYIFNSKPGCIFRRLSDCCRYAGIRDITLSTLRKTHEAILHEAGVEPVAIRARLGKPLPAYYIGSPETVAKICRKEEKYIRELMEEL